MTPFRRSGLRGWVCQDASDRIDQILGDLEG